MCTYTKVINFYYIRKSKARLIQFFCFIEFWLVWVRFKFFVVLLETANQQAALGGISATL